MSFNFNGVNKNKVYMNGVEVTKAYINGVEFYTSDAVYKLNFDAANQDNIEVSSSFIWNTNSDIDFEIEFETNDTLINTILDIGVSNNPNSGRIRLAYANNTGFAQLLIWRPNDIFANYSLNLGNFSANTKYILKVNNSEVYLDGVLADTIPSTTFDIDSSIRHRLMFNTNGVIYNYNFNGESFPLNEGSGNTITGDNGTVGTINTSNAAGIAYIDANIWEEIIEVPYQLNFDAANQDYVGFGNTLIPNTFGDIDVEISVSDTSFPSSTNYLFYLGGAVSNSIHIRWANNLIIFRFYKNSNLLVNYVASINTEGVFKLQNGVLYFNNVVLTDQSSFNSESLSYINTLQTSVYNIFNGFGNGYSSGTLVSLKLQGESFPLNEGSGNTITGDNGTVGTINTSNAAGIAYIDANVWEEIV